MFSFDSEEPESSAAGDLLNGLENTVQTAGVSVDGLGPGVARLRSRLERLDRLEEDLLVLSSARCLAGSFCCLDDKIPYSCMTQIPEADDEMRRKRRHGMTQGEEGGFRDSRKWSVSQGWTGAFARTRGLDAAVLHR
jgi:hypothetical protein